MPMPSLLLPAAFCSANLIVYWGGFDITWKLVSAMAVGLVLFAIGAWRAKTNAYVTLRNAVWLFPWLAGQLLIGWLGRYGIGAKNVLPEWVDIAVVIVFALFIFYWAVRVAASKPQAAAAIEKDAAQLDQID